MWRPLAWWRQPRATTEKQVSGVRSQVSGKAHDWSTLPRMSPMKQVLLLLLLAVAARNFSAQSVASFPPPDAVLADVKHKEPRSGVQLGPGNTLTIQSGTGTPTTINALAFSKDSRLLAAAKDFGRVVVWDVPSRKFLCAVDTGQGIVHAVALSADGQQMVTGGEGDRFSLKLWHLPDGKLERTYNYSTDTRALRLSVQPVRGLLSRTILPSHTYST